MLLIKWNAGNGRWRLAEAASDLRYPTSYVEHEVEVRHEPGGVCLLSVNCSPEQIWLDSGNHGLPSWDEIEISIVSERPDNHHAFVRPLSWTDKEGVVHALVTDSPVYILNERGDTIETIR